MEIDIKKITVEEAKRISLEILKDVAAFCDNNGLTYFLTDGTLLGAIRHKGFIPWDDDIDIMMPRMDYEKFIQTYKSQIPNKYMLASPHDKYPFYYFTKVYDVSTVKIEEGVVYKERQPLGIDIDIFPIDGQAEDEQEFRNNHKKRKCIYRWIALSNSSFRGSIKHKIATLFAKMVGSRYWVKKYNKIAQKYTFGETAKAGTMTVYGGLRNRHSVTLFQEKAKVIFEEEYFWAPKNYHQFLENCYGDYMTPPPLDEQITHHSFVAYHKEMDK